MAQVGPGPVAPTREEVERPSPTPVEQPPARLDVEGGIERAPCALDRPEYRDIRFTPTEVVFEDLKGLPAEALRSAYAPYLNQEQPVVVVCEIRDRAATILRDAGYIAAVTVPEQRIADGHIRFQVLMARLVALRVRGDAGRSEKMISDYLEPLTREEVFNRYTAERQLLLAGELPGYTVRLALRSAGQAPGEVIGEVTVIHTPATLEANVENYGSRSLGRWGATMRGQLFGLTGLGDRTVVSAFSTLDFDEQQTLQIAHDFRVGSSGLALAGSFTYAWAHPDVGDPAIDITSKTLFANFEADYPLVRSQAGNVVGAVGFELVDQDVDFNDLALSKDRMRVLFARMTANLVDANTTDRRFNAAEPRWRLGGVVELRRGLNILGASEDCRDDPAACLLSGEVPPSTLAGDPTGTVVRGSMQGEFRPLPHFTIAAGARGQYSETPLFSFEQISGGNYTVGRGYDPGSIIGDRGVGLQAELRYGSTVPKTTGDLAFEPYVFIDRAKVWNEDRLGIDIPSQSLTSAGGGVRASFGGQMMLDLTFAAPLDRIGGAKPDSRVLLSLTSRLLPWNLR